MNTPMYIPPPGPPQPAPRRRGFLKIGLIVAGAIVVLIVGIGVLGAVGKPAKQAPHFEPPAATCCTTPAPQATQAPASPAQPTYTVPQQQAIASALSYLTSGQGFSKLGLIHQLHSRYGEGFSVALARFAVRQFDHPDVWRHQAVISARGYMQTQPGWSFSGLVGQLDSPYGENFTLSQAEYAAHKVGL